MVPILDEASLVPCANAAAAPRIGLLAKTLSALDSLGVPRALRSVSDAPDRDLGGGRGLRSWCFDKGTDRDAGRLVALRLGAQPYIDGADGLFSVAEAGRAVDATVGVTTVVGAGFVALTNGLLVLLQGSGWSPAVPISVRLQYLSDDQEWTEDVEVLSVDSVSAVEANNAAIVRKLDESVPDGTALAGRLYELFPRLVFGTEADAQIRALRGSEAFFPQILRHLRALDSAAAAWTPNAPFAPAGVTFSVESGATLDHGTYGPMRIFASPPGFSTDRWSLHTKLTGGPGVRLYYKTREVEHAGSDGHQRRLLVAVGYLGPHLPTVRFN